MSNLPTVTSSIPRDLRNFVDRLRDMVNGGGANSLVSAKDLVSAGIATLSATGGLSAAVQPSVSYGPPPAPTNVVASGAVRSVIVTWDDPTYTGHSYAELWGASTDDIGAAVILGQTPGSVYTDALGSSATRYYWVRFVNVQDTAGPYNAIAGTRADTGPEVSYLLSVLADQISTNELNTSLNTRIDGIETNTTAIQTEATTRATADTALASSITTLSSTVNTNNTTVTAAIQTEATTRASQTGDIYAKYSVKVDVAGHVSGFGLISTGNAATPYASFGIRANQFFIAPPATVQATAPTANLYAGYVWVDSSVTPNVTKYYDGASWTTTPQALPFVVQASPTTVNGVSVPAGVYIGSAYIQNGVITNAKIANAAIDDAKIASLSADKITAGTIAADRLTAAVVNAKVTNIDTAVIQSGFISAARINTASIANVTIDNAKITDAAITNAKIADASITAAKIVDANITNAKIADAAITSAKITDAAITTAKIGTAQITTATLAGNAVSVAQAVTLGSTYTSNTTETVVTGSGTGGYAGYFGSVTTSPNVAILTATLSNLTNGAAQSTATLQARITQSGGSSATCTFGMYVDGTQVRAWTVGTSDGIVNFTFTSVKATTLNTSPTIELRLLSITRSVTGAPSPSSSYSVNCVVEAFPNSSSENGTSIYCLGLKR